MQGLSGARGLVLAVVSALHAGLLLLLLHQKSADARPVEAGTSIEVALISQARPEPDYTPPIKPVFIEHAILVPTPEVNITLPVEPSVTVAALDTPVRQPPSQPAAGTTPRTLMPADYLHAPQPRYPVAARQAHQQGMVMLLVLIDADGRPVRVQIERSSGHATLDRAAIDTVRTWLFRPVIEAGVAKSAQALVPVNFAFTQRVART